MRYGATLDDWYNLVLLGYEKDLLPVVSNPNTPVAPKSSLKQLGKVPSRYNRDRQIVGIANWTQHKSTAKEIETWSKEDDFGICIQTREIRALDIDVSDPVLAKAIEDFLLCGKEHPVRRRANSAKLLVPFIMKGEFPKRVVKVEGGIIEFLANGQQFVAIGTHPSGARYEGLENVDSLPEITIDQFEALWKKLIERFAIEAPSSSTLRNAPDGDYAAPDEVSQYLADQGHVTGIGKEGQHFLKCPFAHEHTDPDEPDGTSTAYFPPSRGYEQGHWRCLHAHCHDRGDADFLDAIGYRIKDFDVIPPEPEAQPSANRFACIPGGEFIKRPRPSYYIKGVVPQGTLMQIYGGSGDGKTFVTLDMMLAIARGVSWNGRRVKQGRIVYVCAEDADGVSLRYDLYCRENKVAATDIPFGFIDNVPNFRETKDIKDIAASVNSTGTVDIIVIDTLAQVSAGADENTGKDMSVILKHCQELHRLTGALLVIIHHAGKDESKGARGWSGIKAPLDASLQVSREGENRKLWVDKMKNGRDGYGWNFRLDVVPLYEDEDGDIVDSCLVKYEGDASSQRAKKVAKGTRYGKNQILLKEVFMRANAGGEVHPDRLKEDFMKEFPPARSKFDKREQRYVEALNGLIAREDLKFVNGMLIAPL